MVSDLILKKVFLEIHEVLRRPRHIQIGAAGAARSHWCCMEPSCGATIKSDSERTTVAKVNNKHSGPHPVTMRALTSPHMSSSSPATPSAIGTAVTRLSAKRSPSHSGTPTGTLTSTAASCRPSPTLLVRSPFEESSPNTTPRTGPLHCSCGLEAENMELKRRIDQLTLRGIKFLTTPSSLTHVSYSLQINSLWRTRR
ncbi:hypothetical protein J6590_069027 [Homalodisca vitripennis]|nr:hypothetical protein J6590_069027 [Homalodisca vitripennis]